MKPGGSRRTTSANHANTPDRPLPLRTASPLGTKNPRRSPEDLFGCHQHSLIFLKRATSEYCYLTTSKGCDARAAPTNRGAPMKSVIIKRSIVLNGHKTSVSLENEFWEGLRQIAESQKSKVSALVQRIDRERTNRNLSSAIRIYVFNHFRERFAGERPTQTVSSGTPLWAPPATSLAR